MPDRQSPCRQPTCPPTNRTDRGRAASEFLALLMFFAVVYTGALLGHGYGL